ncbi:hypothetical protein F2P81_025197 [Scophthalmus maximus]|uniref:Sorting nexin/Vps5-like C-terminal domain-containing protein n=1 Tax=Scophthalmus maximus TaxID=52904 RepID=A0A6A4RTN2_SCOMX|nr:hypothetical protein F2P81_025197 [Scophthalmus maximus]
MRPERSCCCKSEENLLPRAVSTQALSSAGLLRMVNKAADAVNKMTIKMNESDALAEVEEKIDQLHQDQANADFYLFSELLGDYVRLIAAVKGVFDHRMKTWQKWQDGQMLLQKKREAEAKLQLNNKPDKLQQAKDEIKELEAKVHQGERDFEQISKTIRKEVGRFEKERVKDFKTIIIKYLESLVQTQQQHGVMTPGDHTDSNMAFPSDLIDGLNNGLLVFFTVSPAELQREGGGFTGKRESGVTEPRPPPAPEEEEEEEEEEV